MTQPTLLDVMTCELCYVQDSDVQVALAWYRGSSEPIQSIARCRNTAACRARVEARGDPWPLREKGEL